MTVLSTKGFHVVDLAIWATGQPYPRSVCVCGGGLFQTCHKWLQVIEQDLLDLPDTGQKESPCLGHVPEQPPPD